MGGDHPPANSILRIDERAWSPALACFRGKQPLWKAFWLVLVVAGIVFALAMGAIYKLTMIWSLNPATRPIGTSRIR